MRRLGAYRCGVAISAVARVPRITRSVGRRLVRRSDYGRWRDSRNLELWWETRSRQLAQLIPHGSRVIEFGAGRRQLERFLDATCTYIASDLVDRGPGTIICDLNKRPLPDLAPVRADTAVFSGVLEYVKDLEGVVAWLAGQVSCCVASYACVQAPPWTVSRFIERSWRAYHGYMNDYTEQQLLGVFAAGGFSCRTLQTWQSQRLFLFTAVTP